MSPPVRRAHRPAAVHPVTRRLTEMARRVWSAWVASDLWTSARQVRAATATGNGEGSERMFASMRRYRLQPGSLAAFMRRVDESFADEIAAQPGFVSYQLIDCGGGDLFTLSMFLEPGQAESSRDLARRWTEHNLQDIEHTRFDSLQGESVVSRAAPGMLDPVHVGDARKCVSIRLYRLGSGSVQQLLQRVDEGFAD